MASIASKNLFDLLGNDPEQDPDRAPEPPTKAIDKPVGRTGKRNASAEAPKADAGRARGGARGGPGGNEGAFRDRQAGSFSNRSKDDGVGRTYTDRPRGSDEYRGRGRGARSGFRGGRGGSRDDRHSRTGVSDHQKQVAHGWGGTTGGEEWADEKAGEAIAKDEEKQGFDTATDAPVNAEGETLKEGQGKADAEEAAPPEPEDKSKSLADYLAEQAEKKLQLGSNLEARKPNEGSKKKFPEGKQVVDDAEDFFVGGSGKAKRERERKQKETVDLDDAKLYQRDAPRDGFRGGRGGRGGRGDGGFRGDRGDRGDRSDRHDRSDRGDRGDRGEGRGRGRGRGEYRGRGGRGGSSNLNLNDSSAFPSLGS